VLATSPLSFAMAAPDLSFADFGFHGNFINGKEVPAADGATMTTTSPATGGVCGSAAASQPVDVDAAVGAATAAQPGWWARPAMEREAVLLRCADALERNVGALARVLMWDSGSVKGKAMMEVMYSASLFRTAAGEARRMYGDTFPNDKPHRISMVIREPIGVVLIVTPFNAPMVLCVKSAAFALAAGNSVVAKASPDTPLVSVVLARVLYEAGVPPGVFNVVNGTTEAIAEYITAHKGIQGIGFTGSTAVGAMVGATAARTMKRVHLELGGKNPLLVMDDVGHTGANITVDKAVQQALMGSFYHSGQICMASSRIIVHRAVADEFLKKLAERADKLKVTNDLLDDSVAYGPIANTRAFEKVHTHVEAARAAGAQILCGGTGAGLLYRPTVVLLGDREQGVLWREETFGPVTVALVVDSLDEAIEAANDTDYGLSAAVLTNDVKSAFRCVREIKAGSVHVGMHSFQSDAMAPVGGVKMSGVGKTGGKYCMEHFTELKWAAIEIGEAPVPPAFANL